MFVLTWVDPVLLYDWTHFILEGEPILCIPVITYAHLCHCVNRAILRSPVGTAFLIVSLKDGACAFFICAAYCVAHGHMWIAVGQRDLWEGKYLIAFHLVGQWYWMRWITAVGPPVQICANAGASECGHEAVLPEPWQNWLWYRRQKCWILFESELTLFIKTFSRGLRWPIGFQAH